MHHRRSSRRAATLAATLFVLSFLPGAVWSAPLQLGLFADLHAHEVDSPGEGKVMANYAERLQAFVDDMSAWQADLVIQLGDFVNGVYVQLAPYVDVERIPLVLEDALALLAGYAGPVYHVIGNHDVYSLSKQEFLDRTGDAETYFSFDAGAFHFVVLDAQYDRDGNDLAHMFWGVQGNIPEAELDWLRDDLAATDRPTVVCIHQPLDVESSTLTGENPIVINNHDVMNVLVASGVVVAVFQGHDHENRHSIIDGIHYVTFQAMVDHAEPTEPSWARITLDNDARTIVIAGHGDQADLTIAY